MSDFKQLAWTKPEWTTVYKNDKLMSATCSMSLKGVSTDPNPWGGRICYPLATWSIKVWRSPWEKFEFGEDQLEVLQEELPQQIKEMRFDPNASAAAINYNTWLKEYYNKTLVQ